MLEFPSADYIAELSFQKFNSLPKTGKPTKSEWTILSCIIQFDNGSGDSKVVALGAGTKCIGKSKLCPQGLILNDSHAEILARRAFLRYIFHQLKYNSDLFTYNSDGSDFSIKESISFHFFSTQIPCGDACIVDAQMEPSIKRAKLENEFADVGDVLTTANVYTGAKLIGEMKTDPMNQTIGALRTKPGRGDRTLSMSCSDKLAKWNVLGCQGALLDQVLMKPIYLKTLDFACKFDNDAMTRAIYERWKDKSFPNSRFIPQKPKIREAIGCAFEFAQDANKSPSPNGLVWCDIPNENAPYEVSVNGKKQGITKKALQTKKAALRISKVALLDEFCDLINRHPGLTKTFQVTEENTKTYRSFKSLCRAHQAAWSNLKESYFQQWTTKPNNLLDFTYSNKLS